jgi:hypothetical protein
MECFVNGVSVHELSEGFNVRKRKMRTQSF